MKKIVLIIPLIYSVFTFGQKNENVNLIQADSTWGKEIIKVPFWFAPKIDYKGFEDIRFAKGWEDIESDGFWVLAFAWDINLKTKPSAKFFEENLKLYYDGLMKVVNEDEKIIIPKTEALFAESTSKKGVTYFTGIVKTFDAFTTKKTINLYVTVESNYCEKTKKYIPLFRFSPKEFIHKSWEDLNKVKLQNNLCN
ncbi:MAG: hypothetical protein V3V28_12170 [Polaribacter sp.]|uniref:hypothetical protein n=1 Tax=Polaribacter sp. TaxID=1920175 RepID=UPI002F34FE80